MSRPSQESVKRSATKTGDPADRTAALANKLKSRADRRASRSVAEDLLGAPLAAVLPLTGGSTRDAEGLLGPAPAPQAAKIDLEDADGTGSDVGPETAPEPLGEPDDTTVAADDAGQTPVSPENTVAAPPEPEPESGVRGSAAPAKAAGRRKPTKKAETPRPVAGPDGRLELSGERVVKMTLELPLPLVDALAIWERDETKATGQRVYRERLIDCALSQLPADVEKVVDLARALPVELRHAETDQVGTRVRASIQGRLKDLRPELRVRRVKDVYLRHVYAAAIADYLQGMGVSIPTDAS